MSTLTTEYIDQPQQKHIELWITGHVSQVKIALASIAGELNKFTSVTYDLPVMKKGVFDEFLNNLAKIQNENEVFVTFTKEKIFYIGKSEDIENAKVAIEDLI